ncbi:ACRC [Cordylochernes scorpioides]|uniref:ACRC n=1 Tax=Cordylochernes scorpioides TaxID=51811 RepID=A0ABY6LSF9_9ARAC|nr:ACRC [Cordylochernes scorpioides]
MVLRLLLKSINHQEWIRPQCCGSDRLRDTLIHELCHAANWMLSKKQDHHGPEWKSWAMRAQRAFPELPPINSSHYYKINTKFVYKCTRCGTSSSFDAVFISSSVA